MWLSADPLSGYNPVMETEHYIDGQHNGGVFNSFNLNTYGYCYQNPVLYVDPNGKQSYFQGMFNQSAIQAAAWNQQHPDAKQMTADVVKDAMVGVKNDVANVAGPIIRSMPEKMQSVGDGAAIAGYGLTLTGVGAELGVPLANAGNALSLGGTGLEILINLYDGKYSESRGNAAKALLIEAGQRAINSKIDKIPGASEVKKEVLKQTVDMTVKAVDQLSTNTSQKNSTNKQKL